jgi:hypothetical protein
MIGLLIQMVIVGLWVSSRIRKRILENLRSVLERPESLLVFVLSGFLTFSLLHREQGDSGRISLRTFYDRKEPRLRFTLQEFLTAAGMPMSVWLAEKYRNVIATRPTVLQDRLDTYLFNFSLHCPSHRIAKKIVPIVKLKS